MGASDDGKAVGLPPRAGEDSRLCLGMQNADLDSTTKEIWMQIWIPRKKKLKKPALPYLGLATATASAVSPSVFDVSVFTYGDVMGW